MPRGVPRGLDDRVTELDQQIARLRARKEAVLAREKRQRKRWDQHRAKIAGEAVRRVNGSWEAPELLAWIERFLISDRERNAFGFKPLEPEEKDRRFAGVREREARWEQSAPGNPRRVADGQQNQPDGDSGDALGIRSSGEQRPR